MRTGRFQHVLACVLLLVMAVLACAWIAGRVFSDRFGWSQPVSWVPPAALAAPVWFAVVVAGWRARRRRRRARATGRAPARSAVGSIVLGAGVLFTGVSLAHLLFVELGLHRLARRAPAAGGASVRLVFWNQAGQDAGDIAPVFVPLDPTVFVLANRHSKTSNRDLVRAFSRGGPAHRALGWPFDLFSRLPIRRWGVTSLGLEERSRSGDTRPDSGWAAWYELDTEDGPLVVWAIDLPSDPRAHRMPLARRAGRAVAGWRGATRLTSAGSDRFEPADHPGFPVPDIVVGDFNIPRGSASLRAFLEEAGAGTMRDAFGEAGFGWQRTWPRERPVWAIDQCFVGPRVRAVWFRVVDPGVGGHRALVVEVSER